MRYIYLPRYQFGKEPDFIQMAEDEREKQRQIAWQYLQAAPSIQNLYNAAGAFWKSLPIVGVSASDMNPYVQTGIAPSPGIKPQGATKLLGSEKSWIDYANQLIKKNKLQTVNAGGKTYVKTQDGKMRSLLNFGRDEYQNYQQNLLQQLKREAGKMTGEYTPYETYTPTRLSDTRGSINKVKGKLSNRNAYTANNIE